MDSFKESVSFWATVLGTVVTLLGLIQSRSWLLVVGALVVTGSIGSAGYAEIQKRRSERPLVTIEGRSIDALNIANLRRKLNRNLLIQRAENLAVIDGSDITITWKCAGYCRVARATTIEFTLYADANAPFSEFNCVAYDLRHDPKRLHAIRPILVGPDGIEKKIAVPFLNPLIAQEPFEVALECRFLGCMKPGIDYYTTTFAFDQATVPEYAACLRFHTPFPRWVRVYEVDSAGAVGVIREVRSKTTDINSREYVDEGVNVYSDSARIYLFSRSSD